MIEMRLPVKLNILSKINLLATVLIVLTSSGIAVYAVHSEKKHMISAAIAHSESLSMMIADHCEYGIYTRDAEYLERILQSVSAYESIARIVVFDAEFNALVYKKLKPVDSVIDFSTRSTRQLIDAHIEAGPTVTHLKNKGAIEFIQPVMSQGLKELDEFEFNAAGRKSIGYVHLVVSMEQIEANTKKFLYSVMLLTLILVAIGAILMLVLGKRIAAPIVRISQVARDVADGNLDHQIAVAGEGEISDLARAINFMLERLRSYRQKVEASQKNLEHKVSERTRELEQLAEESKQLALKAEAASRSKSEFLANMSHELRTPLNHILGFTELVAGKSCGEINAVQEEYLNDVLSASRHLLSLINDILDLSKVEAGKMDLDAAEVPIRTLLENSLCMVKEKAIKHGIQLSLHIESAPESLIADERKLKQVMYNLLSNAVKFTPAGGTIEVGSRVRNGNGQAGRAAGGAELAIWVKDSGIGLEAPDRERIFAPFEQVESSISRKFQGTGLGLALTKKMVELHGGVIEADSAGKDQGTTFQFTLPIGMPAHCNNGP